MDKKRNNNVFFSRHHHVLKIKPTCLILVTWNAALKNIIGGLRESKLLVLEMKLHNHAAMGLDFIIMLTL